MKKVSLLSYIFVIVIFSSATTVEACWCRNDPEETNTEESFRNTITRLLNNSDFVFAGTLIEENNEQLIFNVEESWKGKLKGNVIFSQLHNVTNGKNEYFVDSCEFTFERDKTYLVYANVTMNGFSSSKCGRTNFWDQSQRDINELNKKSSSFSKLFSKSLFYMP